MWQILIGQTKSIPTVTEYETEIIIKIVIYNNNHTYFLEKKKTYGSTKNNKFNKKKII